MNDFTNQIRLGLQLCFGLYLLVIGKLELLFWVTRLPKKFVFSSLVSLKYSWNRPFVAKVGFIFKSDAAWDPLFWNRDTFPPPPVFNFKSLFCKSNLLYNKPIWPRWKRIKLPIKKMPRKDLKFFLKNLVIKTLITTQDEVLETRQLAWKHTYYARLRSDQRSLLAPQPRQHWLTICHKCPYFILISGTNPT